MPNQLTDVQQKVSRVRSLLEHPKVIEQLTAALPEEMDAKRVIRTCMTLVQTTPKLILCSPTSILIGLMQASELGLLLNGVLGHAYLIPRKPKNSQQYMAVFQMGYQGYIELAWRSNRLLSFSPQTVHEKDEFDVTLGTSPNIYHKPAKGNPGPTIGYYSTATFTPRGFDFVWMTREQVEAHRQKFADPSSRAWQNHYDSMGEVTVMRRLGRRLPKGTNINYAAAIDTRNMEGIETDVMPECLSDGEITEEEETAAQQAANEILEGAGVETPQIEAPQS